MTCIRNYMRWVGGGEKRRDDFLSTAHCEVTYIVISVVFCSSEKTKSKESSVLLEATKEIGPKVTLFCGLIIAQVGRRHLFLLQQRSSCTPAVVGDLSQCIATQKCMWNPPSPHKYLRDTEGTWGSNDLLVEALLPMLSNCIVELERWERCLLHKHHIPDRKFYICSTPTCSIQVPRSLQLSSKDVSRQGLLSFGFQ